MLICLCDPGKLYLVYLKRADRTTLDLTRCKWVFSKCLWFSPREGGALQLGSTQAVTGGEARSSSAIRLAIPVKTGWPLSGPGDPNRDYPPGVSAGADLTVMLPRSGETVRVDLNGERQRRRKTRRCS